MQGLHRRHFWEKKIIKNEQGLCAEGAGGMVSLMGLFLSLVSWAWLQALIRRVTRTSGGVARSLGFGEKDIKVAKVALRSLSFKRSNSQSKRANAPAEGGLERSLSFGRWQTDGVEPEAAAAPSMTVAMDKTEGCPSPSKAVDEVVPQLSIPEFSSPRPRSELDAAAVTLQKVYKSYRTRRNLADCAVVVEELWWKALDFASLKQSSVSFFESNKQETAISRWSRACTRAAKVGKGLSKDEKAQKLALRHWLEAIDPRHRYGHNLHIYYDIWFESESAEPFFYWLDVGGGREVNMERCPRSKLQQQCIRYLGPSEREAYQVILENGMLVYKQTGSLLHTTEGIKWIFVLSTSRALYVGKKQKGAFQHSSFLSGGATTAAGRLVAEEGVLKAIWPYSGHYLPTEENFKEFISFLEENNVDLTDVKRCSIDDDQFPSSHKADEEPPAEAVKARKIVQKTQAEEEPPAFEAGRRLSCKWSTGTGPRIGCVRDYPTDLQCKAMEQVNLSPKVVPSPGGSKVPIPSPRPSPGVRLSPRLAYMGIPSPKVVPSPGGSKAPIPSPRPSPGVRLSPQLAYMGIPSPKVRLTLPQLKSSSSSSTCVTPG